MKSIGLTSSIILLIACFSTKFTFGQISQHLYQSLPDSLRPVDYKRLTLNEFQKVLINRSTVKSWGAVEYHELSSLCYQLGPRYITIANVQDRLKFLLGICGTLYDNDNLYSGRAVTATGRKGNYQTEHTNVVANIKYIDTYISELKKHRPTDKTELSRGYYLKSFFQFENDDFTEAINSCQLGLAIAKESNNRFINKLYAQFAYFYNLLGLPTHSLVYCDSARATVSALPTIPSELVNSISTISSFKQRAYLSLFIRQPRSVYADSIRAIHKQISYDQYTKGRRKATSYIVLAGMNFYQQNYKQTLAYLDSAQHTFPELHFLLLWQDGLVYKGVSLLRLGRKQEAKKVLEQLNFLNVHTPAITLALQELISVEKQDQNRDKVLHYHDLLLAFTQRRHALEMQGKALEMTQKYNLSTRD
uniref:tetratricopeptide repeat protein n=1 Tax=Spirosoma sp. TaxID=1899569 RepID=UPI003B3BB0D8